MTDQGATTGRAALTEPVTTTEPGTTTEPVTTTEPGRGERPLTAPPGTRRVTARLCSGWTAVALICLAVLVLWLPDLDLPLGNSDDGRILGRLGLQARNFWEHGPVDSSFGALVEPFIRAEYDVAPRSQPPLAAVTYAHHPPLVIFMAIASVGLLGDNLPALRLAAFVMGSATVAFMALLLRVRGIAWGPALVAVAAMACTGFFYVYARIGVGYSLLVASTAAVAWLREADSPPRWALAGTAGLTALTAMQSWIAMATLGLLAPWLFAGTLRRTRAAGQRPPPIPSGSAPLATADTMTQTADPIPSHSAPLAAADTMTQTAGPVSSHSAPRAADTMARPADPIPSDSVPRWRTWLAAGWSPGLTAVVVGAALGGAVTAGWLLNATDVSELGERVAFRVGSDVNTVSEQTSFTFGEFLSRQWRFAGHQLMTPLWLQVLLAPALIAGAADRRTRAPMLITLAFAATLTFGFQQGAWVHRLWNFPWLAPTTIGLAALADTVRRLLSGRAARLRLPVAVLAGLVPAVTLLLVVSGGTRDFYLSDPADAGAVLEQAAPEVDAEVVWVTPGIPTPRWVSYYLDAPVFTLDESRLGEIMASDLVLTRTNRLPDYFPADALDQPVASQGRYRLIRADRLVG